MNTEDKINAFFKNGWVPIPWGHHPDEIKLLIQRGGFRPKMKGCYENAAKLCISARGTPLEDRVRYVEGTITSERCPIPIRHAWVTLDGEIIELTITGDCKHEPVGTLTVIELCRKLVESGLYTSHFMQMEDPPEHWQVALG